MHKHCKKIISMILSLTLSCSIAAPCTAQAAAKPKLSATKLVLEVGSSHRMHHLYPIFHAPIFESERRYHQRQCYMVFQR